MSVETGGHQDQIGPERLEDGDGDALVEAQEIVVGRLVAELEVDGEPFAAAATTLGEVSRVRGEQLVLVGGDEEHVRARLEGALGAVPVVNVPVDDRHAATPVDVEGMLRRDRDVVEEAEAHRAVDLRVVPGWTRERERARRAFPEEGVDRADGGAGGERGGRVGACVRDGVLVEHDRRVGGVGDLVDVTRMVDALDLRARRGRDRVPPHARAEAFGPAKRGVAARGGLRVRGVARGRAERGRVTEDDPSRGGHPRRIPRYRICDAGASDAQPIKSCFAITMRCTSLVPSPISQILASRRWRSTWNSRV